MKKLVYAVALLIAWFAGGDPIVFAIDRLSDGAIFAGRTGAVGWGPPSSAAGQFYKTYPIISRILFDLVALPYLLVKLAVVYRALVWIKTRSFQDPSLHHGFLFILTSSAAVIGVIVMSGVARYGAHLMPELLQRLLFPQGFVLIGLLAAIPVLVCEAKDLYGRLPGRT